MIERIANGFSRGEVSAGGIEAAQAREWGVRVDDRRRTVLEGNVAALKEWWGRLQKPKKETKVKKLEEKVEKVASDVKKEAEEVEKKVVKVEKKAAKKTAKAAKEVEEAVEKPVKSRAKKKPQKKKE
jgi:ribosomal L13e-like protein